MSRKADPAAVGAFIVGAALIAIWAIIFFGSGKLFSDTTTHVSYFPGSIKGLDVGAPVTFRGVRIGSVTDIQAIYDVPNDSFYLPVVYEIENDHFQSVGDMDNLTFNPDDDRESIAHLIEGGLRAQLDLRSLVTGQLNVELDMFPGTPVTLSGHTDEHIEIPTLPTGMQRLTQRIKDFFERLEKIPVDDIGKNLGDTLAGINAFVNSDRTTSIVDGIDELVNSPDLKSALANLDRALVSFDAAMRTTQQFVADADTQLQPIVDHVMEASKGLEDALNDTRSLMRDVRNSISEDSELRTRTTRAMEELEAAAQSVRILADYLERHPESLIKGKPNPGGDR